MSALARKPCGAALLLLLGCAAIALCEFLSGLTENQIIAAVAGFSALLLAYLVPSLRSMFNAGSAVALAVFTGDRRRGFSGGRSAHPQLCAGVPDLCGALPGA